MKKIPFFSIIVPMYYAQNTIERCVQSLIQQTFADIEILLINDGSADSTDDICKSLVQKDSRIRYFTQKNKGVSAARNVGIKQALGKYLLFVDSDDYLRLDYCERLYRAWEKNNQLFYWTAIQIKSESGKVPEKKTSYGKGTVLTHKSEILSFMEAHLLNSPCNKMYNLHLIKKYGIEMPEDISIAEDLLFNIQYFEAEEVQDVCILNDLEYIYVRNGDTSLDNCYNIDFEKAYRKAFAKLEILLKQWNIWEEKKMVYQDRYWQFFLDVLQYNVKMIDWRNYRERIGRNNKILADPFFKELLQERKKTLSRSFYWCSHIKKYELLYFYHKLFRTK